MQVTKVMLAVIATFLLTWLILSFIGFTLSDTNSFKEIARSGGVIMFMLIFGWIPAALVGMDYSLYLEKKEF